MSQTFNNLNVVCFYDENKQFLSSVKDSEIKQSILVPSGAVYCRIRIFYSSKRVQLESGDKIIDYEEYIENKTTILLPAQLQKIGDVAGRLYWDNTKKKYIIEKKY